MVILIVLTYLISAFLCIMILEKDREVVYDELCKKYDESIIRLSLSIIPYIPLFNTFFILNIGYVELRIKYAELKIRYILWRFRKK
jgi:hypothetical protein